MTDASTPDFEKHYTTCESYLGELRGIAERLDDELSTKNGTISALRRDVQSLRGDANLRERLYGTTLKQLSECATQRHSAEARVKDLEDMVAAVSAKVGAAEGLSAARATEYNELRREYNLAVERVKQYLAQVEQYEHMAHSLGQFAADNPLFAKLLIDAQSELGQNATPRDVIFRAILHYFPQSLNKIQNLTATINDQTEKIGRIALGLKTLRDAHIPNQ